MNNATYRRLTMGLIALWFALALSASALHLFQAPPDRPPLAVGLAVLIPLVTFFIWFSASAGFRRFLFSISPRTLTFVQSWRVVGYTFLVLYAARLLPGVFALSAGWGDIAIGVTAPLAAIYLVSPGRRRGFIFWQSLGLLDLVTAVFLGTLSGRIDPTGVPTALMSILPMSLIPTFAVPLLAILHVICIAQARQWEEKPLPHAGKMSPLSA